MFGRVVLGSCLIVGIAGTADAQPLLKSAINVEPGNTKPTGATFGYRLTYNCSSTSGPCLGAQVIDLLPAEVQQVSTVPASPTGDVAAINVTPNYMGTGRTRVVFTMISPLPAGNSGDLLINVRFPNGSTPDGAVATNTADGINFETTPGTFITPPVNVTAVASAQVTVTKTLQTSPANLDLPETYRLRISVPNTNGALSLTAIGPVVDTLPPGTVFNGATPAADCQPGCVGTTPATVTWTSPCSLPLSPNQNCDILVNVTFPSATFPSGTNVTNDFVADVTPLGEPTQPVGPGSVTHPVTTFVPSPGMTLAKNVEGGSPNPPTLNQTFTYELVPANNGNVPLDSLVLIDTLPVELQVLSVRTGSYNGLADFAVGEGVRVSYEKNTALGVFTLWGSSPGVGTNTTLTAPPPGLGAGEYLTRIRWEYGQAQPGMAATNTGNRPRVTGQVINPDNGGGPVAFGDTITNCVDAAAVYTAGPTNVARNACRNFVLSGPFVQLNPAKENLSGGGPFNPGQSVSWRLRVRSDSRSSDPIPLEELIATDLLPVDLLFSSWTFDDQGTGLPAPQVFDQIPNFAGTGRTLLRWRWNAGSGNLGVNQQVWLNVTTAIRSGAAAGALANDFTLEHDSPGLSQRCSGSSQADPLDLDQDGDTGESLCRATGTITIAGIAQLISSKVIDGVCDGGFGTSSAGTLFGGAIDYRLRVQNVGTVPMTNFVLIDILPFVGDTGVRDTLPRGSQWTPELVAPIVPPPGTTVYYSTSGNPCRGEVGGPTTSCDLPGWSTVAPEPITTTRSIKVEFGSRVINPFDFVEFDLRLGTPADVAPGQQAFNSFAYQADRGDGLGSLAAEPQKVGIEIGTCDAAELGDYVWVDSNGDGLQNDGPSGLNGVYVELVMPGADGLPRTLDDLVLTSMVTQNGPSPGNAPGWYSFPGLAPGSYYVQFHPPATYAPTIADVGGDDGLDSDADPITACSPLVTLGPNQVDPTIDLGLIDEGVAALGDYVWFDRNADGLQNDAVLDGVNGVTVRLWADDGDGVREPGTGDALVAATATATDVYGRPGYYRFDGLIPGQPYFVQFVLPAAATGFTTRQAGGDSAVDSDAGVSDIVVLAGGDYDSTLDAGLIAPAGLLALGDQVWFDVDDDGVFEPQDGEVGIDGVHLELYRDVDGDGQPGLGEYLGATSTATAAGFAGRYRFSTLPAGTYIVVVAASNFEGGGPLDGWVTSTGNDPAPDPDDDVNGDDNGAAAGAVVRSLPVTLTANGEPTSEDGNNNTNLTVDFGFVALVGPPPPAPPAAALDFGDAPDVEVATSAGDYRTTALDDGARHALVLGGPFLGACVDADSGLAQDAGAALDDALPYGLTLGTCSPAGDDEDGVTFSTVQLLPGQPFDITVTPGGSGTCVLDAWIDWNRNGVFGDAGEVVSSSSIGPATAVLPIVVPAGATPGPVYARFRCSTAGGLGPAGPAADGEVEDYRLEVRALDYGDHPDSYGTLQASDGARHVLDPANPIRLGSCVDADSDGAPAVASDGDDTLAGSTRFGLCFDDEDGLAVSAALAACQTGSIGVTTTSPGGALLDAWIDWSDDGSFAEAGDQVASSLPVANGPNSVSVTAPCTASDGELRVRLRLSSVGGLASTGLALDGEVEDHVLALRTSDFGDAPDSYGTTFGASGPHHALLPGFVLGATVDGESEGAPSPGATGDGADEDGVSIPGGVLVACSATNVVVTLTNTAGVAAPRLDAWIDFDGDGSFDDPRDRVASGLALVSGANVVPVTVPCDAGTSASYSRWRLSSAGVATPLGPAFDGEVEDWAVGIEGFDFGDAPDPTFPTLLASNGARHQVLVTGNPVLGGVVDTEADGAPHPGALGDDLNGSPDDEDGVVAPSVLVPGTTGEVEVSTATGGELSAWIDFDRSGSWEPGEQIAVAQVLPVGSTTVSFAVPVGAAAGTAISRYRLAPLGTGVLATTGAVVGGEIEDHPVAIGVEEPAIGVGTCLISVEEDIDREFLVTLELRVGNYGNVPLTAVNLEVDFDQIFLGSAGAIVESLSSAGLAVNPVFDGRIDLDLLAAGNDLAVGQQEVVELVVRLDPGGFGGPYEFGAVGRGTSPATVVVQDQSQDGCDPDPNGDNDPEEEEPTPIGVPVSVLEIPTATTLGLWLMGLLLALAALRHRRMG
jgi:uncharacterized repeat protein (TIGR01451 family)